MKHLKFFLTAPGALIVLICFFLPWVSVSCGGIDLGTVNGSQLAGGFSLNGEAIASTPVLWFIPVLAIIAALMLILPLLNQNSTSNLVSGTSQLLISIFSFIVLYFGLNSLFSIAGISEDLGIVDTLSTIMGTGDFDAGGFALGINAVYGLYLVGIGLILILIGGIVTLATANSEILESSSQIENVGELPDFPLPPPVGGSGPNFNISGPRSAVVGNSSLGEHVPETLDPISNTSFESEFNTQPPQPPPFAAPAGTINPEPSLPSAPIAPPPQQSLSYGGPAKTVVLSSEPQADVYAFLIARDVEGITNGETFPVQPGGITVGRTSENNIALLDSSVSSNHAKIRLDEDMYVVNDLASTNGTFVYKKDSAEWEQIYRHELSDGDQIKFGRSVFSFVRINDKVG